MSLCFATIVSANYLAYARVLARSLAEHCEGAPLKVLLVERSSAALRALAADAGLDCVFADELGLQGFERLAYKYDVLELNTALKPTFLKRLLSQGHERVVYVDPDIRFFAPALPVMAALDAAPIVLTPHALQPVLDSERPSDVDFLRNGVFNLGFIAVRAHERSLAMLDWWEQRCLGLGFNDPGFGTFVDQKWADLIPAYFAEVEILRHPGCNVAYWNLHEREVSERNGKLRVGTESLVFFHFSGVDPYRPEQLSRHQTRHDLAKLPDVARLVRDYGQALIDQGHDGYRGIAYSFGTLRDGSHVSPLMRRALLSDEMALEADPFDPQGRLQRELRACGISHGFEAGAESAKGVTTRNLADQGRRLLWVNRAVRLLSRLLGPERAHMLLSYAAMLTRESHFASVLMDRPMRFKHEPRR